MTEGIRAPNLQLGTSLSEFIGIETIGTTKSLRRFTRDSVVGLIEAIANSFQAGGGVVFKTKAEADAHLAYNAFQMAWVIQDSSAALNGVYQKSDVSGFGGWARVGNLPYSFYRAVNSGAGTANAIVATNNYPLASTDALIVVNITAENTSGTVTVSFNGGPAYPVKTAAGNDPAVGGFVPGMVIAGYITPNAEFHLITDQSGAAIQAAAEAAQAAAENARDLAIAAADQAAVVGAGDVPTYPSRALAAASTIPTARTYLFLAGYAAKGDGPLVMYVKMSGTPSPVKPWQFQSADGAYWELSMDYVTPEMFGAKGDGVMSGDVIAGFTVTGTDDADELQAWADCPILDKRVPPNVYATTKTVNLPVDSHLRGIKDKSWIAGKAGGTWTSSGPSTIGAVVNCGGSLFALPALSASGGKAATSVTLVSAPIIFEGDVLVIYNPTDNSYMTDTHLGNLRPYYRDGEMVEVASVSGDVIGLKSQLLCTTYSNYATAEVDIYRIPRAGVTIRGVGFHAPHEQGAMALNLSLLIGVRLENVAVRNSDTQSIQIDRCYDFQSNGHVFEALGATDEQIYALCISNSQFGRFFAGKCASVWHAFAVSSNDGTGCIPNRDIHTYGAKLTSTAKTGTDAHGNSEDIHHHGATVYGGVECGGSGGSHVDCKVYGGSVNGGVVVLGSEIRGGDHLLDNCDFYTEGDPTDGRGVIDIGGNSVVLSSDTRQSGRLRIKNCRVNGASITASTPLVKIGTHETLAVAFDVEIDGLRGPSQMTKVLSYNVAPGAVTPAIVKVDNITGFAAGALLADFPNGSSGTLLQMQEQSGHQAITAASGDTINVHALESFRYSYPFTPHATAGLIDYATDNSKEIGGKIYAIDNQTIRCAISKPDLSAFTATVSSLRVSWTARLRGLAPGS